MPVFRCCVCGRTEATSEDLFFYFVDGKTWCDTHVPPEIKRIFESI